MPGAVRPDGRLVGGGRVATDASTARSGRDGAAGPESRRRARLFLHAHGDRVGGERLDVLRAERGRAPGPPLPVPAELTELPRPIYGYAGTLHESRLDIDLIVTAARAGHPATFAFLGPDLLSRDARRALFAPPNVRYLGGARQVDETSSSAGWFELRVERLSWNNVRAPANGGDSPSLSRVIA